jgi:hypothetical protein
MAHQVLLSSKALGTAAEVTRKPIVFRFSISRVHGIRVVRKLNSRSDEVVSYGGGSIG